MTIELELLDSATEEVLAAAVDRSGHRKDQKAGVEKDPVTGEELDAQMRTVGERVRCQLDNARRAEGDRKDCRSIVIPPIPAEG